jgi:hypothetical protein
LTRHCIDEERDDKSFMGVERVSWVLSKFHFIIYDMTVLKTAHWNSLLTLACPHAAPDGPSLRKRLMWQVFLATCSILAVKAVLFTCVFIQHQVIGMDDAWNRIIFPALSPNLLNFCFYQAIEPSNMTTFNSIVNMPTLKCCFYLYLHPISILIHHQRCINHQHHPIVFSSIINIILSYFHPSSTCLHGTQHQH